MRRRQSTFADLDWTTISIFLTLITVGWTAIYASTFSGDQGAFWNMDLNYTKQLVWIAIVIGVGAMILMIDSKIFVSFSYLLYAVILVLLVGVLLFGAEIKGSKSWLLLGPLSFQPSELAKFAAGLALARYLSQINVDLKDLKTKLIAFALIGAPMLLILLQGDLGSALVFTALVLVLFREGLEPGFLILGVLILFLSVLALVVHKLILIAVFVAIAVGVGVYFRKRVGVIWLTAGLLIFSSVYVFTVDYTLNNVLQQHQRDRINVLVGKGGNDWNIKQSKIAIGSGGLSGKGFLKGTQTKFDFVPEQSTDFIFCTIGEEFGFIGSALLILLFVMLFMRLLRIAERQRSKFTRIYGYCVAAIIFFHFTINLGMTMGLVPVIGIPLPFISYGGSSLLGFTVLLFILLRLDAERLMILR